MPALHFLQHSQTETTRELAASTHMPSAVPISTSSGIDETVRATSAYHASCEGERAPAAAYHALAFSIFLWTTSPHPKRAVSNIQSSPKAEYPKKRTLPSSLSPTFPG